MNELLRSIIRVQELLQAGAYQGAEHVLETAAEYAKSAESLISAQTSSMTELHIKVKSLTADVEMYKERMEYWEMRGRSIEDDARNIIPYTFKTWWAMIEAEYEIMQEKFNDSAIALSYMGCGASCHVTAGEIRKMLGDLPDDTLDTLRAHGLEDHLTGSDQDA